MACNKNSANTASAVSAAEAAAPEESAALADTPVPMRRYVHPIPLCCSDAGDAAYIVQLLRQQTDLLLQIRALLLGYPPCCR